MLRGRLIISGGCSAKEGHRAVDNGVQMSKGMRVYRGPTEERV